MYFSDLAICIYCVVAWVGLSFVSCMSFMNHTGGLLAVSRVPMSLLVLVDLEHVHDNWGLINTTGS